MFGRGGKITADKSVVQKFGRAEITDKYDIEVLNELELGDTPFRADTLLEAIKVAYTELTENYREYLINQDSQAITNAIQNDIETRERQGDTDENIARFKEMLEQPSARQRYIDNYFQAQQDTANQWISYLNASEYPYSFRYMMLKAVLTYNFDFKTNDLVKRTNKTLRNLTPFDAGVLAQTFADKSDYLLQDYALIQYKNAEAITKAKEIASTSTGGKWLLFKGGRNASEEEISENAKQLSQLVQDTYWCTKTAAKSQLQNGNFYVYVTEANGEFYPRIAIRMNGDDVGEVRGNASASQDIEPEMLPIAEEFLVNNIPNNSGKRWLDSIQYNKRAIEFYERLKSTGLYENCVQDFGYLKKDEKLYTVDYGSYNGHVKRGEKLLTELCNQPNPYYGANAIITKTKDFDPVNTIVIITESGSLDFVFNSEPFDKMQDTGNVELVIGNLRFSHNSNVVGLTKIKVITGRLTLNGCKIKSFGMLEYVGDKLDIYRGEMVVVDSIKQVGELDINSDTIISIRDLEKITKPYADNRIHAPITDLGKLKTVNSSLDIYSDSLRSLQNLEEVNRNLFLDRCFYLQDLGNLQTVGGDFSIQNTKIKSLKNLKYIGGNLEAENTLLEDLGNLKKVNGRLKLQNSKVTSLGNLEKVYDLQLQNTKIADLGNLTEIQRADFTSCEITDFSQLKKVSYVRWDNGIVNLNWEIEEIEDLNLQNCTVLSLGELRKVTVRMDMNNCNIESLGKLEQIGSADFDSSTIKTLGNLKKIDNIASFRATKITSLGKLEKVGYNFVLRESTIQDLGNLVDVGELDLRFTNIKTLGKLKTANEILVAGTPLESLGDLERCTRLDLELTNVNSLGNLKVVSSRLVLNDKITDLGNLEEVGSIKGLNNIRSLGKIKILRECILTETNVEDLGDLEQANYLSLNDKIKSLKNVRVVSKHLVINSNIRTLGELHTVGQLDLSNTKITDLGKLRSAVTLYLNDSRVISLGNLEEVSSLYLANEFYDYQTSQYIQRGKPSMITSFGNLQKINENFRLPTSVAITSLGNIEKINGDAYFNNSQLTDLGALKTVKGNLNLQNTKVESFGELKTVDGRLTPNGLIKSMGNIQKIGDIVLHGVTSRELWEDYDKNYNKKFLKNGKIILTKKVNA